MAISRRQHKRYSTEVIATVQQEVFHAQYIRSQYPHHSTLESFSSPCIPYPLQHLPASSIDRSALSPFTLPASLPTTFHVYINFNMQIFISATTLLVLATNVGAAALAPREPFLTENSPNIYIDAASLMPRKEINIIGNNPNLHAGAHCHFANKQQQASCIFQALEAQGCRWLGTLTHLMLLRTFFVKFSLTNKSC